MSSQQSRGSAPGASQPSAERRRGAPRSEASRVAILTTVARQLAEHGYDHLTIERVAAEAHVGKQTIYRWWPTRGALVAECLAGGFLLPEGLGFGAVADTGDLRADLTGWLTHLVGYLRAPGGEALLRSIVGAAVEHEGVALRLSDRLGVGVLIDGRLRVAAERSELPSGAATTELGEALLGALVVHVISHQPLDDGYAERLVGALLVR